jgi:predicted phage gp36 major capsid-like protein
MDDDQRRAFSNLILFCKPHHDLVDNNPRIYEIDTLARWKTQRESDPEEALERLREVSPSGLRKIVADGLHQHDEMMMSAISRLESTDREAAALMRSLIDELTEAYSLQRKALNPGLVEEFSTAVRQFRHLSGAIEQFSNAVGRYERMPKPEW